MKEKKSKQKVLGKVNYFHICDYASLGDNGKINILGIFENISSTKFPFVHSQMFIVVSTSFSSQDIKKETIVLKRKSDGYTLLTQEFPVSEASQKDKSTLVVVGQLNMISFENYGEYVFEVYVDGTKIAEKVLDIFLAA